MVITFTYKQCLKWSKKEAGSLLQPEVECPSPEFLFIYFWSENGEFWCILGGILCDLELQESKQETHYKPGKSKGAGSPTLATRPHFKPCLQTQFGEDECTQFRVIVVTDPQTNKHSHTQDRLQYTAPQLASTQCKMNQISLMFLIQKPESKTAKVN